MSGRNHFVSDFPGVFAAKLTAAGFAVFWPWYLHGTARFAVGIPWTGTALLIGALVLRARVNGARR